MESHWNTAPGGYASSSTAQTGHQGDWQEEIYQGVKQLKDAYYTDLREIHQKLSLKLNQLDSMVGSNVRAGDQIEKMKHFKLVLERLMTVVSLSKHQIQMGLKDKIPLYEKQILSILQNNKKVPQQQSQAGAPSDQSQYPPPQQSQPGMPSQQTPQQQQSQQMDNHPNQLQQQLNTMTQSNNLIMPNGMQQGVQNTLQLDQLQENGTGFGFLQQGPTNSMDPPQMVGSGAAIGSSNMSHAVIMGGMQTNMSSALVLKQQQQHQEQIQLQQRLMPSQQQMQQFLMPTQQKMQQCLLPTKQQIQQPQLQQRLMQKQQLLQQQLPLLQQFQQEKQHHPQQNQMQQLNQPSDQTDIKSKQGITEEMGLRDNLSRYEKQILVCQQQSQAEAKSTMDLNWNAMQDGASMGPSSSVGVDSSNDWRWELQPDARQRIVNKVMDILKRRLPVPVPVPEELNELQKIAVRFEEKIYSAATSRPDYLRKISLKMLPMETKAQPALNASLPNQNQIDPGLQQSLPGLQSQQPQQLLQQLEQMDNHPNQLQPQLNIGTPTQSNSSSMPNAMQQDIQNTLQSDQLLTKDAEIGHPPYSSAVRKPKKCRICDDCVHKRRNVSD